MKIRVLTPAIDEISDAALWLEGKRAGLGSEFWRLADNTLVQIGQNPFQCSRSEYATDDIEIRFAVIRRFNYVVHFAVEADEVQIVSVAHAGRQPGHWLKRIRR